MLSRVAEHMYWLGRYVERAENTARMVSVSTGIMLDSPRHAPALWRSVIEAVGLDAYFKDRYGAAEERQAVKFLLADEMNPSSIVASLARARENARTTREILPSEVWEQVNDAYWRAREEAAKAVARNPRHEFLNAVVTDCQLLHGMLASTMSRDAAYRFVHLGLNVERADMTTRMLDLGAASLAASRDAQPAPVNGAASTANVVWMSVLLCLSAYQMYHQHVQTRVHGGEVVHFLLLDPDFPRAVAHCLNEAESCVRHLPRHETPLKATQALQARLAGTDIKALLRGGLRASLDDLQVGLGRLHQEIEVCWFGSFS